MSKITHPEMVAKLAKSGADVVAQLTPDSAHLLHMAIGVSGEAGEILEAVIECDSFEEVDVENITEELGDMEFYLEGYRQGVNIDRKDTIDYDNNIFTQHGKSMIGVHYDAARLAMQSGLLLDQAKKMAIYVKPIDIGQVLVALRGIELFMESTRQHFGILHVECLEHNVNKLHSGKNARYKEGSFSNKQANERADKSE